MSITLTRGSTTLELPPDLLWVNEFRWSEVSQSTERSVTGALLIDVAPRIGGRLITLAGRENYAWILRSGLETLKAQIHPQLSGVLAKQRARRLVVPGVLGGGNVNRGAGGHGR